MSFAENLIVEIKHRKASSISPAKLPAVGQPVGGKTRPWLNIQEDISNLVCVFAASEQSCGCEIGARALHFFMPSFHSCDIQSHGPLAFGRDDISLVIFKHLWHWCVMVWVAQVCKACSVIVGMVWKIPKCKMALCA